MSRKASQQYKLAAPQARTSAAVRSARWAAGCALAAVLAGAGFAPAVLAQAPEAAAAAPGKSPPVNAVWVEREFRFAYMGMGTYYSCDGLRSKIEYLLEQVGARKDLKVTTGCAEPSGPDLLPTARIRVAVPAEATPERLADLASAQAKRELVGRVQGQGTDVDAATAQFPAEVRVVEFDGRRGRRIEDGDCELLEQLLPQVLQPLGVKELPGSSLRCTPKQSQFGAVQLKLETLHQVQEPKVAEK